MLRPHQYQQKRRRRGPDRLRLSDAKSPHAASTISRVQGMIYLHNDRVTTELRPVRRTDNRPEPKKVWQAMCPSPQSMELPLPLNKAVPIQVVPPSFRLCQRIKHHLFRDPAHCHRSLQFLLRLFTALTDLQG